MTRRTIFCEKCDAVVSYPWAWPGLPYEPVAFVREGLCASCKPWKHEIKEQNIGTGCAPSGGEAERRNTGDA